MIKYHRSKISTKNSKDAGQKETNLDVSAYIDVVPV